MRLKERLAWSIVAAVAPIAMDVSVAPYSNRSLVKSWFYGAAEIGAVAAIYWAVDQTHGLENAARIAAAPDLRKRLHFWGSGESDRRICRRVHRMARERVPKLSG